MGNKVMAGNKKEYKPSKITQEKLLIVEGADEVNFCKALLKRLGFDIDKDKGIDIRAVDGKDNFKERFETIKDDPGFDDVKVIAFIRDAEDKKANSALGSIKNILKEHKIDCPKKGGTFTENATPCVGVFIMPDNDDKGMLEDLCWKSISDEQKDCILKYFACSESITSKASNKPSKARILAYIAALPDYAETTGVTALKSQWNFDHPCFAPIISFLREFAEGIQI